MVIVAPLVLLFYNFKHLVVMLHGGICHRTSTPRKSGNKMKKKKTFGCHACIINNILCNVKDTEHIHTHACMYVNRVINTALP